MWANLGGGKIGGQLRQIRSMIGPNIADLSHHLIDDVANLRQMDELCSSPRWLPLPPLPTETHRFCVCAELSLRAVPDLRWVAGNVKAEASTVFVDPFSADMTTVYTTSLAIVSAMREATSSTEIDLFNPQIAAASEATDATGGPPFPSCRGPQARRRSAAAATPAVTTTEQQLQRLCTIPDLRGNANADADMVFFDPFPADLTTVNTTLIANLNTMWETVESVGTGDFGPQIGAASGLLVAAAFQADKMKNKVIKLTGELQQIAQAVSVATDMSSREADLAIER
ncbi:hypothetical protein C8R44DRAFT_747297 [Mycena epipterygia]|nr:hypothetical protein C8R44DRAFT_747297 [Mycena epipterygia]